MLRRYRRAKAAPIVLKGLSLSRPAATYLIRVTYRNWKDPQMAANVANGVAESLVRTGPIVARSFL